MKEIIELKALNANATYAVASFGMTFLRFGISLYAGLAILAGFSFFKEVAVLGTVLIVILDYYDGVLFKKTLLSQVTAWRVKRRVLDGVIDRVVIQAVCLPVLLIDHRFLIFYLLILAREILLSGYVSTMFKQKLLLYPGPMAKFACLMVAVTGIAYLITDIRVAVTSLAIMLIFSLFALSEYQTTVKCFLGGTPKTGRIEEI